MNLDDHKAKQKMREKYSRGNARDKREIGKGNQITETDNENKCKEATENKKKNKSNDMRGKRRRDENSN